MVENRETARLGPIRFTLEIVIPEGFYPGSSFSKTYKLDSGQNPAGMTVFSPGLLLK